MCFCLPTTILIIIAGMSSSIGCRICGSVSSRGGIRTIFGMIFRLFFINTVRNFFNNKYVCSSVDKVSHFKSLTRLRDFFIKSHEIYETFETLKTWNLHHKYSVNLFGRSPKGNIFQKNPTILTPLVVFISFLSMHKVFQMSKIVRDFWDSSTLVHTIHWRK